MLSLAWESESVLLELTNSYFGARGIKQNSKGECPLPDCAYDFRGGKGDIMRGTHSLCKAVPKSLPRANLRVPT